MSTRQELIALINSTIARLGGMGNYQVGDVLYAQDAHNLVRIAGNKTATPKVLTQTGTGVLAQAPTWEVPAGGVADEAVDDRVAALIQNGTGITWSYNDGAGTLTPTVTITQYTDEMVDDRVAALIQNGTGITWSYNDGSNTLTPTVTITQYTDELAQDAAGTILTDTATIDFTYNDAGPSITADVINDSITDAKLRNSGALSVIGRSANSSGDPADISSSASGQVLQRDGTTLEFQALKGTTTNDSAAAGDVGELIEATRTIDNAISLTSTADTNVASISLTAGDWDVTGTVMYFGPTNTTVTLIAGAINPGSVAISNSPPGSYSADYHAGNPAFQTGFQTLGMPIVPMRMSLSATTTVYLVGRADFAVSTCSAWGRITARRVR